MGQKVNPAGLRLGINKDWTAKWYAPSKDFSATLENDMKIRNFLSKKLKNAAVSSVTIERSNKKTEIKISTAKPGVVIGHGGEEIEKLKKQINKLVKNADMDAQLVANNIASQIENRGSYRMAQKRAIRNTMRAGAKGIKTLCSGRLNGAEIARSEGYNEGTTPLHTLRANIDYATAEADTTYGKIGVKVWIYKGEILPSKKKTGGVKHVDAKKN